MLYIIICISGRKVSHVTQLHMTHASQLHTCVGRRFKQVQHAFVYSLVQELQSQYNDENDDDDEDQECIIDFDTSLRVIPFLSTFCNLQTVYFGGTCDDESII